MSLLTLLALVAGFGIFALAFVVAGKLLGALERQAGPRRREPPDPGSPPEPPPDEG